MRLSPLVGFALGGAALTPVDDRAVGTGVLGRPAWGPAQLLGDLELRLGLPPVRTSSVLRAARYARRLEACAGGAFYEKSLGVDRFGAARALLAWRDELVSAAWDGTAREGAGARIEALARVEASEELPLPPGVADRVARVERELAGAKASPYETVTLVEPRARWARRWQRIFERLAALGAKVVDANFDDARAAADTDLGRLQAKLRGDVTDARLRGDGTLVLLRAPTSRELAEAVASLPAVESTACAVVRGPDGASLDAALGAHGLASLGSASRTRWRPALQVLPLAVELAFEPRDPRRALELLTLPIGPFQGELGRRLARALAEKPGLGSDAWTEAKAEAAARLRERAVARARAEGEDEKTADAKADGVVARRLARVTEWLEGPAADPREGATRDALLAVTRRVAEWARRRLHGAEERDEASVLGPLVQRTDEVVEALVNDSRERLTLVEARRLVDAITEAGGGAAVSNEEAGRLAHVDDPAALLVPRDVVVWWNAVAAAEPRQAPSPWREAERVALARAGVVLRDAAADLAARTDAWRAVVLRAGKRLVLAVPNTIAGEPQEPHPLWDEIVARFDAKDTELAQATVDVRDVLASSTSSACLVLRTEPVAPLALPGRADVWQAGGEAALVGDAISATSLEKLVSCPLRYVLEAVARVRSGAVVKLKQGPLLMGSIGHGLIEALHEERAFDGDATTLRAATVRIFDSIVATNATTLMLGGQTFERDALREQLVRSVGRIAKTLRDAGLRIVAVEEELSAAWGPRTLQGRLDVRVEGNGQELILDFKWGRSTPVDKLERGAAVQLATYAETHRLQTGAPRALDAAYVTLVRGEVLATGRAAAALAQSHPVNGEDVDATWTRTARTANAVVHALEHERTVPVTGLRRSLPLLEQLGVPKPERDAYLDPNAHGKGDAAAREDICKYCSLDAICGKRWEGLA